MQWPRRPSDAHGSRRRTRRRHPLQGLAAAERAASDHSRAHTADLRHLRPLDRPQPRRPDPPRVPSRRPQLRALPGQRQRGRSTPPRPLLPHRPHPRPDARAKANAIARTSPHPGSAPRRIGAGLTKYRSPPPLAARLREGPSVAGCEPGQECAAPSPNSLPQGAGEKFRSAPSVTRVGLRPSRCEPRAPPDASPEHKRKRRDPMSTISAAQSPEVPPQGPQPPPMPGPERPAPDIIPPATPGPDIVPPPGPEQPAPDPAPDVPFITPPSPPGMPPPVA